MASRIIGAAAVGMAASVAFAPYPPDGVAAQSRSGLERKSERLALAGFEAVPATTPERKAMLARLPADTFARRSRPENVLYVYPDQKLCGCIYVGTQASYEEYRHLEKAQGIAATRRPAARDHSDPDWNWQAWAPLTPPWAGYMLGPDPGW